MNKQGQLLEALEAVADLLTTATHTRFGKPEWLTEEGRAAREKVRQLALRYDVARAETIIGQAGAVARAAIERSPRASRRAAPKVEGRA